MDAVLLANIPTSKDSCKEDVQYLVYVQSDDISAFPGSFKSVKHLTSKYITSTLTQTYLICVSR